ncbi:polyprenyl synthetase family protein [Legionella quateirensis]|uniref:Octaprenyl-diphosphate synthase n=1 Tax=Legionella quateirensis TaxID=45072 RepID=A0A378KTV8_9GAMM|nr:polyprenyl synthetase family protein [Legionella quateirensis]KTD54737.1 octaprenyl-diphosphate synthase [Legionella quateirensis]STY16917.1 octaprenyl-diphosphate synthase [Legionella quateirensis]
MHQIPKDWPLEGTIDLLTHDNPHQSSDTEWWYFNTHITASNGQDFSIFACFFMKRNPFSIEEYTYSSLWALSDLNNQKYHTASFIDKDTPSICLAKLETYNPDDPSLKLALMDVLNKEKIPTDDALISSPITVSTNPLHLNFGDLSLIKQMDGSYLLNAHNKQDQISCTLLFEPQMEAVRQGKNGVISGPNKEHMFYYFIPKCTVQGEIQFANQSLEITHGEGWFDHEFGIETCDNPAEQINAKISWTWMSIHLNNNYDISLYSLYDTDTQTPHSLFCTVIDPSGNQKFYDTTQLHVLSTWNSMRTFSEYGNSWKLQIPELELTLEIIAEFEDQEFITLIAYPCFWEGRCTVKGTHQSQWVTGLAYVEQTNLKPVRVIDDFFSSVSDAVSKEIEQLLPLVPDYKAMLDLIASEENAHLMDGVDLNQVIRTIISPIRTISDRAGKRWRSYALAACCNLVGGDFSRFQPWLAVPELIHTGSLIIDDIQDKSPIRRGGPACHIIYGEPHAINAGTLAYGLFHIVLKQTPLSSEDRCKVYELYFDTFRAAHTGQAIDIEGHINLMAESIKSNDYRKLQNHVLATHRLKSAVPAASLAQMGAILGNGTKEQITILGHFFESVGIAFQIMDDVLNLRGFKNNLKCLAEDLAAGKVTYPIAKSLEYLNTEQSQRIWEVLAYGSKDNKAHQAVIELLESCGALEACCSDARKLVDVAWTNLDAHFIESHTKMMLHAFSYYVINRYY